MTRPPVVSSVAEVRAEVRRARRDGRRVGLVPTMGALHDGHVKLIRACRAEADFTVVSLFVNPAQFGPDEDFTRYPRTPEEDRARCGDGGASLVFAPSVGAMYPRGVIATFVEVPGLSDRHEGVSRPGHFRGVATVVLKLLNIVGPDLAFFGEKDYQQLAVIRRMVADLDVPVEIRGVATVREPDGLAMSSRNRYLGPEDRAAAVVLSRALDDAKAAVAAGERSPVRVRQILRSRIESQGRAEVDYAEVADADTLEPLAGPGDGQRMVALLAVRVGPARLIDNAVLTGEGPHADQVAEE